MTVCGRHWYSLGILVVVSLCLQVLDVDAVQAQRLGRGRVYLPPTRGATVLSTYIDAQARYLVGAGSFLESAAIARNINADSARKEMENSVQWVHTYFKRRELNRYYRSKENPSYMEKVDNAFNVEMQRVLDQSQDLTKGDVTRHLNWMINALATTALGSYLDRDAERLYESVDQPLSERTIDDLKVTESQGSQGRKLSFRPAEGKLLTTRWPFVLKNPYFKFARENFDETRDRVLKSFREKGEITWVEAHELQDAVDRLSIQYTKYYGQKGDRSTIYRRQENYNDYLAGKRYLLSLASAVGRLAVIWDDGEFDPDVRFTGDSVINLVRYMCRRGLLFDKPQPGDEASYRRLFYSMRQVFEQLAERQEVTPKPSKS